MKKKVAGAVLALGLMLAGLLLIPAASIAQDSLRPGSPSLRVEATPPPIDPLWAQVNTCIQYAITNNFKVLPLPGPLGPPPAIPNTDPCFFILKPAPGAAGVGLYGLMGDGYAILKARDAHIYHFLTLPTKAVAGIEDPQINFFLMGNVSTSYSPNYWVYAWASLNSTIQKLYQTNKKVALTPGQMGLAINSVKGRGLSQLHIHMACLNATV